jgi:hypothetical protein
MVWHAERRAWLCHRTHGGLLRHIDARPRRVIESERAMWADNERQEAARI